MMAEASSSPTNEPPTPAQDTGMSADAPTSPPTTEPDLQDSESPVVTPQKDAPEDAAETAAAVDPTPAPPAEEPPAPKPPAAAASASTDEPEKPFDPATDLPMYREGMDWFVLRVASNKENYVRETLMRKVQIEGLVDRVGRIMVPTEKTNTLKGG